MTGPSEDGWNAPGASGPPDPSPRGGGSVPDRFDPETNPFLHAPPPGPAPPRPPGSGPFGPGPYGHGLPGTGPFAPGAPGYPGFRGYGGYVPARTDPGARNALVLSLVAFVCCGIILGPAAIVEGVKARRRIQMSQGALTGDGMALAGIIIGSIVTALSAIYLVFVIIGMTAPSSSRLR